MKRIQNILHSTNDVVLVAICLVFLLAIMIIATTNLWRYVFVSLPILLYLYKSKGIALMQNKNTKTGKKS